MSNKTKQISPIFYTRMGGLLYLLMIILGIVNEIVIRSKIIVPGDTAATASNLKSMESLWRAGICVELLVIIITIGLSLILFVLTKPVNKNLALLAAFFGLFAAATQAAYALHLIEALFPISDSEYLIAFTQNQLNTLTSLSIKSQSSGFAITLLLFGPFFFVTGYLIYHSGYLPKFLGVLYIIPGISYMLGSVLLILVPVFGSKYYFFIAGPALIGELSLSLWLLIKGVNIESWNKVLTET